MRVKPFMHFKIKQNNKIHFHKYTIKELDELKLYHCLKINSCLFYNVFFAEFAEFLGV